MGGLSKLPNIGKVVEEQLNSAGIFTYDELKATGAEKAWLKIQENDSSACIHRLLALEVRYNNQSAAGQKRRA